MDPIGSDNSSSLSSSNGTTYKFVVNCSVDSINSTPKLNSNPKLPWTPSSINKQNPPPLPPKTFLSVGPDQIIEEKIKESHQLNSISSEYNSNTNNSNSNNNNNVIDSNNSTPPLLNSSNSGGDIKNSNSNTSISKDNTITIGGTDEFVIINSEIHSGLVIYDNYGFLIEQEQIQLFLIYKDKIVKNDQVKKDNWINFFEKNPQALQSLFMPTPQPANSSNSSPIMAINNQVQQHTHHYINENNNVKIYRQRTPKIFKELIRSGIPTDYRSMIWLRTSGAFTRLLEAPDEYYGILEKYKDKESVATKQIAMDVERTFPDHKYLNTKEKMDGLSNVLIAYSWRNPSVGYCQCMNFIAGFLLIYMSEHEAYWMLVSIIEDLLPTEYFTTTMIDSSVDVRFVFDDLLQKKLPRLHQHLQISNLTLPLIITQWFLCIMATTTPTETTFRIWDVFFSEGSKVLFRVALSFFKMNEEKLLTCRDYTTLYNLIKKIPNGIYDADHLLDVAFNGLGSFPMKNLIKKRKDSKVVVITEYNEFQKMKASSPPRAARTSKINQ
ncbi:hypothetical protein DLAC_07507 [Tieghemostelium lacteum]|uniref:Rab-GAP TBC domain-containing protein n=1 Tax=Tieghemostelium lacteum TaxID=361077 RepID=A0A151ZCS5_TIELA|nr:hypothetical protein DLAC_07507 [Tieghemostelium lacteum]|eukprot:KYQ91725.1 hypothetical protein DLAC_07507 [Tieghemostelium lacteum]